MADQHHIAIIGNGNVGSALRRGFERAGHIAQAVGRDPDRVHEIARDADVVVLAVPFAERQNAIEELGDTLAGKVVVDVTNAVDGSYGFAGNLQRSGAEELQDMAADACVVKAFNTVFAQNMSEGRVHGEPITLFIAGDDADAKQTVTGLGAAIGFDPVDAGPLENARWLETLGFLNIRLGYGQNLGTDIGLRLVRKETARNQTPAGASGRTTARGRPGRGARARPAAGRPRGKKAGARARA